MDLDDLEARSFAVRAQRETRGLTLKFTGRIDMQNPSEVLDPYFEAADDRLRRALGDGHDGSALFVDLSELSYVSSSGLKPFIRWFRSLAGDPLYRVAVVIRPVEWQRTTFSGFEMLFPGVVTVTEDRP